MKSPEQKAAEARADAITARMASDKISRVEATRQIDAEDRDAAIKQRSEKDGISIEAAAKLVDEEAAANAAAAGTTTQQGAATRPPRQEASAKEARQGEIAHSVRQAYGEFARNIPTEAQSSGVYEPKDESALAGKYDVPDGVYRVLGYDWLMTFKKGRIKSFERARPEMSGDGVTLVPAHT